jgi:hypothetical protein
LFSRFRGPWPAAAQAETFEHSSTTDFEARSQNAVSGPCVYADPSGHVHHVVCPGLVTPPVMQK